jgi:indole-3-glycerol phosphate synthase
MCDALSRALTDRNRRGRLGLIAEIKQRRSDGPDLLRERSAADIASTYATAGAAALSVVTSPLFGGSLSLLEQVAAADLGPPILRKDLVRTEAAIDESKRAGASAVLLVASLLGPARLAAMIDAARAAGIEPFVEVATRQEIERLPPSYDGIVAINNADVKTGERHWAGVARSLELIRRDEPRLWVSASRIAGADEVRRLAAAGFAGVLIGTSLLAADDLAAAVAAVLAAAERTDVPT